MDERAKTKLTPEEAGAFVAQWAENRQVTVAELATRLEIDSASAESLLNRSRGRLSMDKWVAQVKPASASARTFAPLAAVSAACLLIGGLLVFFLFPRPQSDRTGRGSAAAGAPVTNATPELHSASGGLSGRMAAPNVVPPALPSDFRPVPGDGDPVQRAGLVIGTDIAKETSGAKTPQDSRQR